MELPNKNRNQEVESDILSLHGTDFYKGKKGDIANASALLNLSESIQTLQLQYVETSKEARSHSDKMNEALVSSNNELLDSNKKNSNRMALLTGALVFVGVVQIVLASIQLYTTHSFNKKSLTLDELQSDYQLIKPLNLND